MQVIEEDHVKAKCCDPSSSEFQKYRKYVVPKLAELHSYELAFRLLLMYQEEQGEPLIINNESIEDLFYKLGCRWLLVNRFEEALSAVETCVQISKRDGRWWPQKFCARYSQLAFVHTMLGNKLKQVQASMHCAAFAIIADRAKNSSALSCEFSRRLFSLSLASLAAQFLDCSPDENFVNLFMEGPVQAWGKYVAERKHTLQEKLAPGKQQGTNIEDGDLYFALADFLVCNNLDSFQSMLEILKASSSGSLPASEFIGNCDMETSEIKSLMQVCQMDILGAEQAGEPREFLNFVLNLLEVASLELPSEDEGGLLSCVPKIASLRAPCYPGACFMLIFEKYAEPGQDSSGSNSGRLRYSFTTYRAEGSNHDEFEAIIKRLESKTWNLYDPSDSREYANGGRDLGLWATSPSTVAVAPTQNILISLSTVFKFAETLSEFCFQENAAKSMLQDVVWRLIEQFKLLHPKAKEISMDILLMYANSCGVVHDAEERMKICTQALRLADEHGMNRIKGAFYFSLGLVYSEWDNWKQAEEAYKNVRQITAQYSDMNEDVEIQSDIEGAEGFLELKKAAGFSGADESLRGQHFMEAARKLQTSVLLIEKHSSKVKDHLKLNLIQFSIYLCEALLSTVRLREAQFAIQKAYHFAKELKNTKNLKFSKRLKFLTANAAWACAGVASAFKYPISAERFCREGLEVSEVLDMPGYAEECTTARLYAYLGRALRIQGRLPEAEDALRNAVRACSRALMRREFSSRARILTFEMLKLYYSELSLCLYEIYKQAPEDERDPKKVIEALIAAEQGRCRDLMMNLDQVSGSRTTDYETVTVDTSMDAMDWEKFDTDTDYAWGHLKHCMAVCTDAIKEQNPEVERVTFVEYTLTGQCMLIWVLHSHGTQESSTSQETTLPSMYNVDVRKKFQEVVNAGQRQQEVFPLLQDWERIITTQKTLRYDNILQWLQTDEALSIFEHRFEQLRTAQGAGLTNILIELYELLISPFVKELTIGEPLIFIPHKGLSFCPFAALMPRRKGSKHLIRDHPIGYAPSLCTLGWATNQSTALKVESTMSERHPMLLVGDPEPLAVEKDPLDDAIIEVNAIASLLPANSTVTLSRQQATLENVTSAMKTASWFHIACHGEVDPELHPQGVLFLSRSGGSNGCLTPESITNEVRCMTAQAAVLSACKVGQGKITGEGLLGLSRAFMQAGVPLVIAPLLTVDSKLGSAFMQCLYRRMVAGESVMFALRNTMVDVIEKRISGDEGSMMKWKLWDWAAWTAVGFPGVCLPPCH